MSWLSRTWQNVKAAFTMRWSGSSSGWTTWHLGGTAYDWDRVADGRANAAVVACVRWLQRTFPEAPTQVLVLDREGQPIASPAHPLAMLLTTPNPAYSGLHLWGATVADLTYSGNGYWLKVRSGAGRVVELWWVPSTLMEPRWPPDGSQFISHYDYTVNGTVSAIDPADVVHFRDGFDPQNIRKGLSPLASLAREIATDDEAANWTASLLRNSAVPGVVLAPDGDASPSQDEMEEVKRTFMQKFTGDRRGEPMVMQGRTKVTVLSFSPEQMAMRELRRIPEERISACIGVPAVVVGLGSGLDRSTYSNMAEAREAAYESLLIPLQRLLAAELNAQLVPDFGEPGRLLVSFDLSQVRVLQQDQNALHTRIRDDLKAGVLTLDEARQALGLAPLPSRQGEVFYLPAQVTPTEPADLLPEPAPMPLALPAPKLRAVTPGGARLEAETKAADDLADDLDRHRTRLTRGCERDMVRFLSAQADRIVGRLTGGKAGVKDDTPSADELVPASESAELRRALEPWYRQTLAGVQELAESALGLSWTLDDTVTRAYLLEAGEQITGITETTRTAVRDALRAGQAANESTAQLAKRLRALPEFDRTRATLVARTEMGSASNLAAVANYRASGVVVGVLVRDGEDDPICAPWNGRRVPLSDAGSIPALGHPNCIRSLSPITEAADLAA